MKKLLFLLMMVASTSCFAAPGNTVEELWNQVTNTIKGAPSGTTYGIVETTADHIVVATPLGRFTIERKADGTYTFMGVSAKLLSAKNGVYKVATSIGNFTINTKRGIVTKD